MDKQILKNKRGLLDFLGVRENFLYPDFSVRYREYGIPKKNGGIRKIKPPSAKLREVQRKILGDVLIGMTFSRNTFGLSAERGVFQNAEAHKDSVDGVLLNLDIKDFFPSVDFKKVKSVFRKKGFSRENSSILTKLCTIDGSLPQGAPTSPRLSALACIEMDKKIEKYTKDRGIVYTRYFDDMSFSCFKIEERDEENIKNIIVNEGYQLNNRKQQFFEGNTEREINGVVIGRDGVDVSDEYKDKIKAVYTTYKNTKNGNDWNSFLGCVAFFTYINREASMSFFEEVTGVTFENRNVLLAVI